MKMLKKVSDPSPSRLWYNDWISKNVNGMVLDIGKSRYWDYSDTPYSYKSLDIEASLNPDIIADICDNKVCYDSFDYVLCNEMYEFVRYPQKMVDEVYRILVPKGIAVFGFVGKDYRPYKKDWKFYDNNINFDKFKIIKRRDFNKNYHIFVCQKN